MSPAKKPTPRPARTAAPAPATAPVIDADVAFGNDLTAARDSTVIKGQALQNDRLARMEFYDREEARLEAAREAEITSIDAQIDQQLRIQAACDAGLDELIGGSNVVPLKPSAAA